MAASEPARNLSLSSARRGLVTCSISRISSRRVFTGAWCQAAMYGVGVA